MCVIFVCYETRPGEALLKMAEEENDHGIGLAWPEKDPSAPNGPSRVRWIKGIPLLSDLQGDLKKLKGPCMIHFRNATAGGKSPSLTHPFPITEKAEVALEGTAPAVLMHNGTWKDWKEFMLRHAGERELPRFPLSDSRALAWLAYRFGYGLFEVLDLFDRIAVLDPRMKDGMFHTWGPNWQMKEGFWQSVVLSGRSKHSSYDTRGTVTTPLGLVTGNSSSSTKTKKGLSSTGYTDEDILSTLGELRAQEMCAGTC